MNMIKELFIKYKSLIRFAIVGVINTLVTVIINTVCLEVFGIHYNISWVIGFIGGVINSYIMNKLWTFESKKKSVKEMVQFLVVSLISLSITTLGLRFFIEKVHLTKFVAQFPTIVLSQIVNYTGYKFWVFKK